VDGGLSLASHACRCVMLAQIARSASAQIARHRFDVGVSGQFTVKIVELSRIETTSNTLETLERQVSRVSDHCSFTEYGYWGRTDKFREYEYIPEKYTRVIPFPKYSW